MVRERKRTPVLCSAIILFLFVSHKWCIAWFSSARFLMLPALYTLSVVISTFVQK